MLFIKTQMVSYHILFYSTFAEKIKCILTLYTFVWMFTDKLATLGFVHAQIYDRIIIITSVYPLFPKINKRFMCFAWSNNAILRDYNSLKGVNFWI